MKLSYRCMPNIKQAITRHNQQVQNGRAQTNTIAGCNCLPDRECPLDGNCLTKEVIYRAQVVEEDGTTNTYTGLTGSTFKERYYGHTSSFRNRDEDHSTTLSSHIWKLKDEGKRYTLNWKIIDRGKKFNPSTRKCNLCLKEKYHIIFQPSGASLNRRSELFSTCRHRWQQLLENVWREQNFRLGSEKKTYQHCNSNSVPLLLKIVIPTYVIIWNKFVQL